MLARVRGVAGVVIKPRQAFSDLGGEIGFLTAGILQPVSNPLFHQTWVIGMRFDLNHVVVLLLSVVKVTLHQAIDLL